MTRSLGLILACGLAALAFAQPVILRQNVLDGGGKSLLTSTGYRCGFSLGQTAASGQITSSGYKAILGFWCRPFKTGGVSESQVVPSQVREFTLGPCQPNPFGSKAVVSYALPVETDVSLVVFDRAGRTIGTLVSARQGQADTESRGTLAASRNQDCQAACTSCGSRPENTGRSERPS